MKDNYDMKNNQSSNIGFSEKINDPTVKKFITRHKKRMITFSFAAIIVFPILFLIYSIFVGGLTFFDAFIIGLVVGIIQFIIINIYVKYNYAKKSWDGVVTNKEVNKRSRRYYDNNEEKSYDYLEYKIEFGGKSGEKQVIKTIDEELYNYYNLGEKVRYHGGLNTVEKFDKSKDSEIFCNICLTKNNKRYDYCKGCNLPLFK